MISSSDLSIVWASDALCSVSIEALYQDRSGTVVAQFIAHRKTPHISIKV